MAFQGALNLTGKTARILVFVELYVVDRPAILRQVLSEMAHGREDESDLLLVMSNVGGFLGQFAHQHDIVGFRASHEAGKATG